MKWNYFLHLTLWFGPVILGQWAIGRRVFRRNLAAVFGPALIGGTFFAIIDAVAVRRGIWFFDEKQILNLFIGPLPVEEVLFFYMTSLLVSQSFVLLLPADCRR
jgi:lycopene cyclase domain-containing protein